MPRANGVAVQTNFSSDQLNQPTISISNDILRKCVHCGFCLTACPTYLVSGQELESPRGRISLMKATLESQIEPNSKTFEHWDRCIQCRACEPACPSGVNYGLLIESAKSGMNEIKSKSFLYRFNFKIIINLSISNWFVSWVFKDFLQHLLFYCFVFVS